MGDITPWIMYLLSVRTEDASVKEGVADGVADSHIKFCLLGCFSFFFSGKDLVGSACV